VLRTKTWVGALGLLICATAAIAEHGGPADQAAQLVDLPASDLGTALAYLAQRYNVDLIYDPSLIKGINVPRLGGYMTAREALAELVKPSGLSIIENRPGSYLITQAQDSIKKPAEVSPPGFGPLQKNTLTPIIEAPLNEVVVVGTHLSNEIPVGASISVYGAQDLELAGGVSLDNLGRKMTANFTGADSLSTLNTNGNVGNLRQGASSNVFGGAGFNLLGLGPGATLTLLNGHRLAPAGLDGSITDISLIPLSAIDHIEVLTDGASAVYGSDAVAGVVNIVTRSSLEGAETVGRFGRSTQGGGGQSMGAQLFGHSWGTGNALVDFEYSDQEALDASQRDWIPAQTTPYSLEPENIKRSLYVSGQQQLSADTNLSVTGLYSSRAFATNGVAVTADGTAPGIEAARGTVTQAVATATLNAPVFRDWTGSANLNYSSTHQRRYGTALLLDDTGSSNTTSSLAADFQLLSVDLSTTGELFQMAGGMARLSAGLATRYETYRGTVPSVNPLPTISASRGVRSVYSEASFPFVDHNDALRWAQSIDVSIAYRFDDYTDIGSTAKPKLGWSWVPVQGYKLKGTFGESFVAPLLPQVYAPITSYTTSLQTQTAPVDALIVEGGTRGLSPEKSLSATVGAEIEPATLRGFKTSFSYFYIKFSDYIQSQNIEAKSIQLQPLLIAHSAGIDLSELSSFYDIPGFQRDNVGLGPSGVEAIVDNRFVNSSATVMSGLALDNHYRYNLPVGHVDLFASALFILSDQTQNVIWEPSVNVSGTVGEPPKWKIAAGVDWESASFGAEFRVNSISGAQNVLASPYQSISALTTADMAFHYDWPDDDMFVFRGMAVALSVQNILDRHPPLVQIPTEDASIGRPTIPYDGTNASAVGRFIELSVKKRW
jgi:iron complex outermembrane receptor protein